MKTDVAYGILVYSPVDLATVVSSLWVFVCWSAIRESYLEKNLPKSTGNIFLSSLAETTVFSFSIKIPHEEVGSQTLSQWIKSVHIQVLALKKISLRVFKQYMNRQFRKFKSKYLNN